MTLELSEPLRKSLLALHVAVAVAVLGSDLVLLALGIAGFAGVDPRHVYPAAYVAAAYVVRPLALTALVTGVLLALQPRWGLLRHGWIIAKGVIVLALTGAVLFVLVPALERSASRAEASGAAAPNAMPLLIAPAVASALLIVAVVLGVFKPGRRG